MSECIYFTAMDGGRGCIYTSDINNAWKSVTGEELLLLRSGVWWLRPPDSWGMLGHAGTAWSRLADEEALDWFVANSEPVPEELRPIVAARRTASLTPAAPARVKTWALPPRVEDCGAWTWTAQRTVQQQTLGLWLLVERCVQGTDEDTVEAEPRTRTLTLAEAAALLAEGDYALPPELAAALLPDEGAVAAPCWPDVIVKDPRLLAAPPDAMDVAASGAISPDGFAWGGATVDGLSARQWQLLAALCDGGRLRDAVPEAEVIVRVYPGVGRKDRRKALGVLRSRTQQKLDAAHIPLIIEQVNHALRLLPTAQPLAR